jgi:hypothetical protein
VNGRSGAADLRVTPTSLTVIPAGVGRLHAVAYSPAGVAFDLRPTWSSSDPEVVRIQSGYVIGAPQGEVMLLGIQSGTASVTAAIGDVLVSDPATVTVSTGL